MFPSQRLGWPDSSVDSLFCLPPRARCTAQPLVGILIFFPKNTNLFTRLCMGLTDRQAIWSGLSLGPLSDGFCQVSRLPVAMTICSHPNVCGEGQNPVGGVLYLQRLVGIRMFSLLFSKNQPKPTPRAATIFRYADRDLRNKRSPRHAERSACRAITRGSGGEQSTHIYSIPTSRLWGPGPVRGDGYPTNLLLDVHSLGFYIAGRRAEQGSGRVPGVASRRIGRVERSGLGFETQCSREKP